MFGDDVRLEGVQVKDGELRTITSQKYLKGRDSTIPEIRDFMRQHGFRPVMETLPDGRKVESVVNFYNPDLNIAAFDAHSKNIVTLPDGTRHPIDLMLSRPEGPLRERLRARVLAPR